MTQLKIKLKIVDVKSSSTESGKLNSELRARTMHFNPTLSPDSNHGITSLKARKMVLNVAFVFLSCRFFI